MSSATSSSYFSQTEIFLQFRRRLVGKENLIKIDGGSRLKNKKPPSNESGFPAPKRGLAFRMLFFPVLFAWD